MWVIFLCAALDTFSGQIQQVHTHPMHRAVLDVGTPATPSLCWEQINHRRLAAPRKNWDSTTAVSTHVHWRIWELKGGGGTTELVCVIIINFDLWQHWQN